MSQLSLFLPCAGGAEEWLGQEVGRITGTPPEVLRGGVGVDAVWRDVMRLNLWSRIAQRVLVRVARSPYRSEQDVYDAAARVTWEAWFTPRQTFRIEITAQKSPLKSLNFAALRIKDAIADRFRERGGERPSVDTHRPDVRVHAHLNADELLLYLDTSGEPLFKRGWREDKGDAPLKETLAAATVAASGWDGSVPLYDPCCGSGTLVIEAAQAALGMAPGAQRRFGFERLLPFQRHVWDQVRAEAQEQEQRSIASRSPGVFVHGSDVAFRMVDFARRNAERAGVADWVELRGGDALQRMPPASTPGILLVNPPYGERIEAAGVAGARRARGANGPGREAPQTAGQAEPGDDFFRLLAAHWKHHFTGWTAHVLSPDMKLPSRMRLAESRRVPMWNGPIECRLFRFDLKEGSVRRGSQPPAAP